jgi:hypothetical protein
MVNPYYDVWFAAQSLAPESFVMDIYSPVQQIQPDWLRWIGDAPPANQESTWSPSTVDPFQHVFLLLRHPVFRDALLSKATKQMLPKFLEFEARTLAVFCHGSALLLGDLSPAMQPFLYRLAHPGTLAWASKYGFQAMQDLVHCPSYVRTLVPFTVPANLNLPPSLSKLTSKAELSSVSSPKSRPTPGSQDYLAIRRQILLRMLGNAVTTTPDKSLQRRSSRKQAPPADSRSGMVLDFGNESSSVASSSMKVIDPPPANMRADSRKSAAVKEAGANFNPSQHRVTTRVLVVSAWCLPITQRARLSGASGAADAYIFDSPDDEETTVSHRFSRKEFVQQSFRKSLSVLTHIGRFAHRLSLVCLCPIWPPKTFRLIHFGSLSQVS